MKAWQSYEHFKNMKTKLILSVIGGWLCLGAPAVPAQDASTNSIPPDQAAKYQAALEKDRSLGERALLPPGVKEKLQLTEEQRTELKPIEDDFANTSKEYQAANQSRIDAALDVSRQARESKDPERIEAARRQLQLAWSGLERYREQAVKQIKPLLTPDQVVVLEDPANQWRENHAVEANDPSANSATKP
jgi:hypothetical protein